MIGVFPFLLPLRVYETRIIKLFEFFEELNILMGHLTFLYH
jgi:hypothetical protein